MNGFRQMALFLYDFLLNFIKMICIKRYLVLSIIFIIQTSQIFSQEEIGNIQIFLDNKAIQPIEKPTINDYLLAYTDSGDYQIVSYLLRKGANPNYQEFLNKYEPSVLMVASLRGYYDIAALLINKGANVNYQMWDGTTSLFLATRGNHKKVVELLLKNGADINKETIAKTTALFEAVIQLNDTITDILLKEKPNINARDNYNLTSLQYVVGYNLLKYSNEANFDSIKAVFVNRTKANSVCELLIKAGANVNEEDDFGYTPLLVSTILNNIHLVKVLCEAGANPNKKSTNGNTPLIIAADDGDFEITKTLIEHKADINFSSTDGNTALFAAVGKNNDSIAEILLQNGANLNLFNSFGVSPIHYAAGYGYPYMTNLLIDYGAKIDTTDLSGNTPLMSSVYVGAKIASELLINSGAQLNKADKYGVTPLMVAAQFNDTSLIRLLYKNGADPALLNTRGVNALSFAIENNAIEACKLLVELGAYSKSDSVSKSYYQQSVELGNADISNFLISNNLKTKLKPSIGNYNLYSGLNFSNGDFMLDFGGGIYESISKTMVNIGYKYRPHSARIIEFRDNEFYQFWEKRYSIYVSIQKMFELKKNYHKGNIGFTYGINGELTWRFLKGSNNDKTIGVIAPNIGIYYQRDFFTLIGKWEITNYRSEGIGNNRFGLQFLINIPNTKNRVINKKISWLN